MNNHLDYFLLDLDKERSVDMLQKSNQNLPINDVGIHRTQMQKEMIIQKLKEEGCRITKQRLMLLDIILEEDCSCCKEIYYKASKLDGKIGSATVYRMVNTLEEIGAISRKNMYKISCLEENACCVELSDHTTCNLPAKMWNAVIRAGMKACGYIDNQEVRNVVVTPCECGK